MSKIYSLFKDYKNKNTGDYILIVKSGIFYYTYEDDAIILWDMYRYKIRDLDNYEVGFAESSLSKVTKELKLKSLSFKVIDSDENIIIESNDKNNLYVPYQSICKVAFNNSVKRDIIMNKVNMVLDKDSENEKKLENILDGMLNSNEE